MTSPNPTKNIDDEINDIITEDLKRYPHCFHSTSSFSSYTWINGESRAEELQRILRTCPGEHPVEIYTKKNNHTNSENSNLSRYDNSQYKDITPNTEEFSKRWENLFSNVFNRFKLHSNTKEDGEINNNENKIIRKGYSNNNNNNENSGILYPPFSDSFGQRRYDPSRQRETEDPFEAHVNEIINEFGKSFNDIFSSMGSSKDGSPPEFDLPSEKSKFQFDYRMGLHGHEHVQDGRGGSQNEYKGRKQNKFSVDGNELKVDDIEEL